MITSFNAETFYSIAHNSAKATISIPFSDDKHIYDEHTEYAVLMAFAYRLWNDLVKAGLDMSK